MPSFHDIKKVASGDAAAWLRFVHEDDGGVWGALFETTALGEPLSYCFTRVGPPRPSDEDAPDAAVSPYRALVSTLLQAAQRSPVVAFCLMDEVSSPSMLDVATSKSLPVCSIDSLAIADAGAKLSWVPAPPDDDTSADRVLKQVLSQSDPYEPFQRAEKAINEASADATVRAMALLPGLTTVVILPAPPEPGEPPADSDEGGDGASSSLTLAQRLWRALALRPHAPDPAPDVHLDWVGKLMPFQVEGVQALLASDRLLLADDMGLGKTLQAIAALRILKARGQAGAVLVVAPASLLGQWRRELNKWAPELSAIIVHGSTSDRSWQWRAKVDVMLVSYETLRSDALNNTHAPVRQRRWDVVVADEAQRIKNRNDTSGALKGLQRVRSWALTGTPIENNEEELASIVEFVDYDVGHYQPGAALQARHRQLQLRRKKADVLTDLPPKQEQKLTIELTREQRASYQRAEQEGIVYLRELGKDVTVQHVFALITTLKQICNADPETGASSKLEDIKDRLEQLAVQGHKALVFSQYVNGPSGVRAAVNYLGEFNPLSLTGNMSQQERDAIIDRFKSNDEHKALVLSLRAGGVGLNLQEASYVFHLDRWWNPAVERQAEDRTHRIGQTVKVNVIKYSCADTIEQRIDEVLEHKQELFDQLVDDVSLDPEVHFSRDELLGLFPL
ncbi:MAG: DEAD/DEAH box helicase [Chloroflexi bacterium]|nr:DEAD/DEAH box helicase [Chloroflexota bacterium]